MGNRINMDRVTREERRAKEAKILKDFEQAEQIFQDLLSGIKNATEQPEKKKRKRIRKINGFVLGCCLPTLTIITTGALAYDLNEDIRQWVDETITKGSPD